MSKKTYTIGRAGDVTLNDETVSRRHACLEVDGNKLYLRDLESRNGTYEVRDNDHVPFISGPVTREQVFAFGECVRSVGQLLTTAELQAALKGSAARSARDEGVNPFDVTRTGSAVTPRKRLTSSDIIELLERVEDEIAHGRAVNDVCLELGISAQRYVRWCREYGASRKERDQSLTTLRQENERLRKLVADLSDSQRLDEDRKTDGGSGPNLSLVGKQNQ